jgi:pimeloyl-ACP methyl ester carboxylesterase
MSILIIEQQIVHYEVLGRGRPIIFLHGWVGSWRYWIPVMQAASVSYRAYALDFWGFGDTAKNQPRYGVDGQEELLDRFLYEMGIGRVALVGHGLGAVVAMQYALRHPDIVDRVMAVSCPLNETCASPRLHSTSPEDLAEWLLVKSPLADPVRLEAPKADAQAIAASLAGLSSPDYKDAVKNRHTSCLLVNGQNDPAVSPPDPDCLASLTGQAHAVLFEQSGHFPMLDEGSKFNRLLVDFLSLLSGDSPRQLQMKEEWKRRVR